MEKQISFSEGLVSQPYSDVSPDGQLSTMHNLEVHAGGVRPSLLLGKQFGLGGELVFIHKTGYYTHYLFKDASGNLRYKDSEGGQDDDTYYDEIGTDSNQAEVSEDSNLVASVGNIENLKNIAATGNVLTFLCEDKELQYAIWREDKYMFLGVMPELEITFMLEGEEKLHVVEAGDDDDPITYVEAIHTNEGEYEYASGAVGEFEKLYCNAKGGGFVFPFYVRAAWKLYDGSFSKFSAPMLMIPNSRWPCVILPQAYGNLDENNHVIKNSLLTISDTTPTQTSEFDVTTKVEGDNYEYQIDQRTFVDSDGYVIANVMKLQYKLLSEIPEGWKALITGLEIMVSQPMKPLKKDYKSGNSETGEQETLLHIASSVSYGKIDKEVVISRFTDVGNKSRDGRRVRTVFEEHVLQQSDYISRIGSEKKYDYYTARYDEYNLNNPINEYKGTVEAVVLECYSEEELKSQYNINDGFAFFHLDTIPSVNFSTDIATIELREDQYENITTNNNDKYTDTWSHNKITAVDMIEYNGRLNLYNNSVKYWVPDNIRQVLPYTPTPNLYIPGVQSSRPYEAYWADVYVKILRNGITKVVRIGDSEVYSYYFDPLFYVFIPNTEVASLIIVDKDWYKIVEGSRIHRYCEIQMTKSVNMDGVYFYSNMDGGYRPDYVKLEVGPDNLPLPLFGYFEDDYGQYIMDSDTEEQGNTIYTSNADNPFVFTAKGLNQVGGGRIIKLAAMTKPLSEGQMGGFPLIAFCTDGNYALEVIKSGEDAGLYEGVTPMRPDVCINADSILGIEEGIFFVSQKGLMLMQNNDALLLSEKIDGVKDLFGNEGDNEYYDEIGTGDMGNSSTHAGGFNSLRPREYIEQCMPAWDYANSRLLLLRKGFKEAYVFKADDKTWSSVKLPASVKTVLSSYPFSYIQFNGDGELTDGTVVVLDDDYNYTDGEEKDGIIVTRPMKMDTLRLKRINEFALHGNFAGKQKLTIYGSNDLKNWHQVGVTKRRHVGMMPGYFFKFWRFKIETSLKENENISGMEVRYNIKNNGMR